MIQDVSGVRCLVYFSKKTGQKSVVPLLPACLNILDRYNGNLPKRITGQKFNAQLKEVCKLSKIDNFIQIQKSKGYNQEVLKVKKYEAISSHTARRSFVSNMSSLGLTAKEISLMTGHSQIRIVEIYDKTKAEDNAVKIFNRLV